MSDFSEDIYPELMEELSDLTEMMHTKTALVFLDKMDSFQLPCPFSAHCKKKKGVCLSLSSSIPYALKGKKPLTLFCPSGLLYFVLPFLSEKLPTVLCTAGPFFCFKAESSSFKKIESVLKGDSSDLTFFNALSLLSFYPINKINSLQKMLFNTVNCHFGLVPPQHHKRQIKKKCTEFIKKDGPKDVSLFIDGLLQNIVEEAGLDFEETKLRCTELIFSVYEIILQKNNLGTEKEELCFSPVDYAKADTLGKLKDCLLEVKKDFSRLVFAPGLLKHNIAVDRAIEYVQKNYHLKITQNAMAKMVYISPSYFSHLFKEITGDSFCLFLNKTRITAAKNLLSNPAVPFQNIYKMVGYESQGYFGEMFRRFCGMSPYAYRKKGL